MKECENDAISPFHIILTFYSYYFHIFITFLASGPRSGPQRSYFCHIPGHIIFIFLYMPGLGPLSIPQSLKVKNTGRAPKLTRNQDTGKAQEQKYWRSPARQILAERSA